MARPVASILLSNTINKSDRKPVTQPGEGPASVTSSVYCQFRPVFNNGCSSSSSGSLPTHRLRQTLHPRLSLSQLHSSTVTQAVCLHNRLHRLPLHRTQARDPQHLNRRQATKASQQRATKIPRLRPPCKPSRRTRRYPNLHPPNPAPSPRPSAPSLPHGSHVRPRSRTFRPLQQNAR